MKITNVGNAKITVASLGLEIEPGEVVDVDDGYCHPRRSPTGKRIQSAIEMLAPCLVPADEAVRAEWRKVPAKNWAPEATPPTAEELQGKGVPPGVAAIMAEKARSESSPPEPVPVEESRPVVLKPEPVPMPDLGQQQKKKRT